MKRRRYDLQPIPTDSQIPELAVDAWTLPPLIDAKPDIDLDATRRDKLETFLATGGIQKALEAASQDVGSDTE